MDLKLLPSPEALKNIFVAFDINRRLGLYCNDEDEDEFSGWELIYDKKKERYDFNEEINSDADYLYFTYTKNGCFIIGMCAETGREIPQQDLSVIPSNLRNEIKAYMVQSATFCIWSIDGVSWQQLEEHETDSPWATKLGTFLDDGNFANPESGEFQNKYPVLYQIYKQVPFDNEMFLESRIIKPESGTITKIKLPKVRKNFIIKELKAINYPTSLTDDFQVVPNVDYIDRLVEKSFYNLAVYCIGQLVAKNPKDKELMRKAADICLKAKMYMATMSFYKKLKIKAPDLYINAAEEYLKNGKSQEAVKYYLLGFGETNAEYTKYLEVAKKITNNGGWQEKQSAVPLYEKILEINPMCHDANYFMFNQFEDFDHKEYQKFHKYLEESKKGNDTSFWNKQLNIKEKEKYHHDNLLQYFNNCDQAKLTQCNFAIVSLYLLKRRQFEEAYTYIIKGNELKDNSYLKNLQADCLVQLKRYDEAIAVYENIGMGEILEYRWGEGSIWSIVQDYRRNLDELKQLVATGNDLAQEYDRLRQHYESLGAYHKAMEYGEKSILLDPEYLKEKVKDEDLYEEYNIGRRSVSVCMPNAMKTKEGCQDIFYRLVYRPDDYAYGNKPGDKYILGLIKEFHTAFPNDVIEMNLNLIGSLITTIYDKNNKVRKLLIKETVELGFDGIFESSTRSVHYLINDLKDLGYHDLALKNQIYYDALPY